MAVSMVLSFPITLWPMRQDILDVMDHLVVAAATPRGAAAASSMAAAAPLIPSSITLVAAPTPPSALAHYTVTYLSLALIYLVALCVKSAYQVGNAAAAAAAGGMLQGKRAAGLESPFEGALLSPAAPHPHPRLQMVGIVGAITGCSMAFVFPGLLGIRDPEGGAHHVFGWVLAIAGVLLAVIGLTCAEGSA